MHLARVIAQLENKRIVVLGAGLTGMSCVKFLTEHHLPCVVNDSRDNAVNSDEFAAQYPSCQLVLGAWDKQIIGLADILLVSPGIDLDGEGLRTIISAQTEVLGDIELFCRITTKPIIAVTGSNGKSTVVSLLAHVGQGLGLKIGLGGNIGSPVLEQLSDDVDFYVLELSSFQLETLTSMQALAATVLNVSDDHLDRHKTIENYSAIKQAIFAGAKTAVINRDDSLSYSMLTDGKIVKSNEQALVSFGSDEGERGQFGLSLIEEKYYLAFDQQALISLDGLPLAGVHNALNYLAVLALGYSAGWPLDAMIKQLASFSGLAHRCQRINTDDGICWINDSKATNVGASLAAIIGISQTLSANHQLFLLAGGEGKGADFSPLKQAIDKHVAHVFTFGKDGGQIAALTPNATQVADLSEAVNQASLRAQSGDVVLLSPACASLDMFKNYAQRGQVFTDAVMMLQEAG